MIIFYYHKSQFEIIIDYFTIFFFLLLSSHNLPLLRLTVTEENYETLTKLHYYCTKIVNYKKL